MISVTEKIIDLTKIWFQEHGLTILVILVGSFLVQKFLKTILDRVIRKAIKPDHFLSKEAEKKREDTLIQIFHSTIKILIWIVALMMLLSEAGIDIGPLIAAAGVAGLALGFGAQYLIRDVIAGLFIILENQYRVGDVVCSDGTCGSVEDITLRMTTMRDLDGTVHHIPHGEMKKISNLSKNYARVNLNMGVSYNADLEKVIEVVNKVGNDLAEDQDWKDFIIKAPQFLRVDDFADSAVMIKILGDTEPLKQWEVTGELRKRLKIAFDKEGIEIPFPQMVVHQQKT
ncbi:MAG: potassium transporter KefA [Candidatus Zambryskibacteria bacterium RIFCSPLOWO2_01_FULL_35_19]|uniref:Potassium transporter KefA n=1 Tax=Candidatus Zambryskibacteria bacterium RIFCSPLOWO2_01_FULL_35_19 TaxID=1802757 RepID=A0A1G2TW50_9BACT|nr:MAG: potassium transporter KefA [Candidatus Zambryskibacteria bacterium RIFCSPLOWO2_01_FULL_35_19]